jgi:hypothetical protein
MKYFAFFVVGFACAAVTWGQATVETAVGTGAATGAAAGAKGAGKAVGGVFGAVSNILNQAPKPGGAVAPSTGASSTISVTPSTAKVESVLTKPIDPSQVTIGMDRDQLLSRFGEPATRVSQIRRSRMIDTFWYATKNKDELIVSLTDGKVVSTVLASQRKRSTVASTRR